MSPLSSLRNKGNNARTLMNINRLTEIQSALSDNSNLFNRHQPKINTPLFENMVENESILTLVPDILIVDDNTFNVYSLRLLIEEAFHLPCDFAHSAKEALQIIKDRLIEGKGVHKLILTDINMPEIDGIQMAKMIKKQLVRLKNLPIGKKEEELKSSLTQTSMITEGSLRIIPDCA